MRSRGAAQMSGSRGVVRVVTSATALSLLGAVLLASTGGTTAVASSPPIVTDATITPAQPTDPMLHRGITLDATATGGTIASFDYGWTQDPNASAPSQPWQHYTTGAGPATLDFGPTTPASTWTLMVRATDSNGLTSAWNSQAVSTPNRPQLIAIGDSVTSGHHRDTEWGTTYCDDPLYGYPATVFNDTQAALPAAWRNPNAYVNVAHSGFSTSDVQNGNTTNACGQFVSGSPLQQAEALLQGNVRVVGAQPVYSWDRVVMTAGIDNTNWDSVITTVIEHNLLSFGTYGATACAKDASTWDGYTPSIAAGITAGIAAIVSGLRGADPAARIAVLGYYNIAGTGTNPGHPAPAVPSACSAAVSNVLKTMAQLQIAGLPADVGRINSDALIGSQNSMLQYLWLVSAQLGGVPGWPHPNSQGAAKLGLAVTP